MPERHRVGGAKGGYATARKRTPEQRWQFASRAHLASCVASVIKREADLTTEQRARLRVIFG